MEFKNRELVFKWKTGSITIMLESILACSPAYLKKLINTATENREEVEAEISAIIRAEIAKYSDTEAGKKAAEKYIKLLAAVNGEKQGKREKIVAQIIKNNTRYDLQGIFEDGGKYCVIDGYRLLRFADPIPGFQKAAHSFNTVKAVNQIINQNVTELALPSVKDLRADIKLAKNADGNWHFGNIRVEFCGRTRKVYYDFGYDLPMVNAEYLLSMLEALPNCQAYTTEGMTGLIYFVSGNDDGGLCPARKEREYLEPAAEKIVYAPFPVSAAPEDAEEAPAIDVSAETAEDTAEPESACHDAKEQAEQAEQAAREDLEEHAENVNREDLEEPASQAMQDEPDRKQQALSRVKAVAAAVQVSEEDNNILSLVIRLFENDYITEEEAKRLLAFPVSAVLPSMLALPAHVEEPDSVTVVIVDAAAVHSANSVPVSAAVSDTVQDAAPPGIEPAESVQVSAADPVAVFILPFVIGTFCASSALFYGGPPGKVPDSPTASPLSFCACSTLAGVYPAGYFDTS